MCDIDGLKEVAKEDTSSPSSKFRPESLVPDLKSLSYDPVHVLRAHSERDNPNDDQTQVS